MIDSRTSSAPTRPAPPGPTCSAGSTSTIREGEFVTIMGPSGAGKSTLLGILGMLDHAWTGEFHFLGEPVHALSPKKRVELNKRYIGFVFQKYHLLDDLTVYENLEIPLSYRDVKPKERAAIVAETLDRFQMVGKKDLYPSQLSGGQQQLVGVARAVIASPKLLLADEPTGNLHSAQGEEIMELVHPAQPAGDDDRAGDALREERVVRAPHDPAPRRVDRAAGDRRGRPQGGVRPAGPGPGRTHDYISLASTTQAPCRTPPLQPTCSSRTTSPTSARRSACCSRAKGTPSRPPTRRPPCWRRCSGADFDAVLLDLNYARDTTTGREGLELVSELQALDATLPAVVMTAWGSVDKAVEAMRRGRARLHREAVGQRPAARHPPDPGRARPGAPPHPAAREREPAAPARRPAGAHRRVGGDAAGARS